MTPLEWISDAAWTSIPVIGMSIFVWWLFRSLIRADATERKTYADIEAEERERLNKTNKAVSEQGSPNHK